MELKISPESIENLKIAINPNFKRTDENSKELPLEDKSDLTPFVKVQYMTAEQKAAALEYYRKLADSDGRIELKCVCDSTLMFQANLYYTLVELGCTDIRTESREATPDEIPKDKPWCSWFYAVSGKLHDVEETNNE